MPAISNRTYTNNDTYHESWWQAADLNERCHGLTEFLANYPSFYDQEQSSKQKRLWLQETHLGHDRRLSERLHAQGLSQSQFEYVLGESATHFTRRMGLHTPPWQQELENIYHEMKTQELAKLSLDFPDADAAATDFLEWPRPLIFHSISALSRELNRYYIVDPQQLTVILELCRQTLCQQCARMIQRTLLQELEISRLQKRLTGPDAAQRYQAFIEELKQPERALMLLSEYPVLARQLLIRCRQWRESHAEFFQRLHADKAKLSQTFNNKQPLGYLVELDAGSGDRHADGRSVMIARFSNDLRLVYKPKSLAIDLAFQQLIEWLNACGFKPRLPVLKTIDCGAYGWCEFISHSSCNNSAEIERFFRRQGAYLALLYALEATDFHYENIIAQGEMPYLIDLETLLQPLIHDPTAVGPGSRILNATVLRNGMLPLSYSAKHKEGPVDLSGLGDSHGRPTQAAKLHDIATDTMHLARIESIMPAGSNQALYQGRPLKVEDHADSVLRGFSTMYRLLMVHRDTLVNETGPLAAFKNCRIRYLIRGTDLYFRILHAGFHPDYLESGLTRSRLLDKLWMDYAFYPAVRQLIPSEQWAIARGDVPCFHTSTDSRDLIDDQGRIHRDFFPHSGFDQCLYRIGQLNNSDLERQYAIVRDCLIGLRHKPWTISLKPESSHTTADLFANQASDLIHSAHRLASHLDQMAIRHNGYIGWFQPSHIQAGAWGLEQTNISLYDGLCGIGTFFAAMAQVRPAADFADTAKLIWRTIRQRIIDNPLALTCVGAYSGWGGIFYTAKNMTRFGMSKVNEDEITLWYERLRRDLDKDQDYDLISGSAGAIMGLLRWYEQSADKRALTLARECGDYLLDHAEQANGGLAWPCAAADGIALTGLGHGAAGIALALALLHHHSGNQYFHDAAIATLRFENAWFSPRFGNWCDRRKSDNAQREEEAHLHAWCHGGPGIGLGRLELSSLINKPFIKQDLQTAVRSTLNASWGYNQSLCHGDLGNLELIQRAGDAFQQAEWQEFTQRQLHWLPKLINSRKIRSGLQIEANAIGLMNGYAGMGYALLRFSNPERYPSLLSLQ